MSDNDNLYKQIATIDFPKRAGRRSSGQLIEKHLLTLMAIASLIIANTALAEFLTTEKSEPRTSRVEMTSLATVTQRFSTEASNNIALFADHGIVLSGLLKS